MSLSTASLHLPHEVESHIGVQPPPAEVGYQVSAIHHTSQLFPPILQKLYTCSLLLEQQSSLGQVADRWMLNWGGGGGGGGGFWRGCLWIHEICFTPRSWTKNWNERAPVLCGSTLTTYRWVHLVMLVQRWWLEISDKHLSKLWI